MILLVPGMPEVITPQLERRVKERMAHNQTCNKQYKRKYILTGFVKCGHCGRFMTGQSRKDGTIIYRHSIPKKVSNCPFRDVRGDFLERAVLDYLYNFFLDEPAYSEAIQAAIPSGDDRKALEFDIRRANRRLGKVNTKISNLADAIIEGADRILFLDKQEELKAEKEAAENRLQELNSTLSSMPCSEDIKEQAELIRMELLVEHIVRDWRTAPYKGIRRFLHFLFSENPRKTGYGISVAFKSEKWYINFDGCVNFPLGLIADERTSKQIQSEFEKINTDTKKMFEESVKKAKKEREKAFEEIEQGTYKLKPFSVNN